MEGILPIPNDDEDYLDYVDVITEGGDPYGPFTGVYIDTSQITFDKEIILKGFSHGISPNINIVEFNQFTFLSSGTNIDVGHNKILISIKEESTYYDVHLIFNSSSNTISKYVSYNSYYYLFNYDQTIPVIIDNNNDRVVRLNDNNSTDTNESNMYLYKSLFTINFNSE